MAAEIIKTNICIVGAGPAGATTSIVLGKMGIPHVIVDAADFPRDKICGDCLDLKVVRVLNQIDPAIVTNELTQQEYFAASAGMRFILPNGKHVELIPELSNIDKAENKPVFYVSKRGNFDNLLVEKIDRNFAETRFATRIEKIEREGNQWRLYADNKSKKIEIEARMIVGADGDHSVVLKHLQERKIDRNNYAAAIRQYWKGVEGMHPGNLIEIYFPAQFPFSYFWIFPLPNGEANVGYGMASYYAAKKNINIRKTFAELIENDINLAARFKNAQALETAKGWGIPMAGCRRKAYGDGWLLVGDAASVVSPTSGEGIGTGMFSGFIAAHFLQRAVQQNKYDEKMFTAYQREIHKRLSQEEWLYRFANAMPAPVFTAGINMLLSNSFIKKWCTEKEMKRWLNTAYHQRIEVDLDE